MIFINFSLSHYVSKKDDRCYTNNWIFRDSEIMMDICNWWAKLYIYDILSALVHTFNKIIIWRNDLWSFDEIPQESGKLSAFVPIYIYLKPHHSCWMQHNVNLKGCEKLLLDFTIWFYSIFVLNDWSSRNVLQFRLL